jgi:hypothetical protein
LKKEKRSKLKGKKKKRKEERRGKERATIKLFKLKGRACLKFSSW